MIFLLIISFLLISFLISYRFNEHVTDAVPVSAGCFILGAYIFALVNGLLFNICGHTLHILNLFPPVVFLTAIIWIFLIVRKDRGTELCLAAKRYFLSWEFLTIFGLMILITLLTKNHEVKWWDDINFWATDAKALYYLDGFSGKYGNAAPEFGDYPPALQIFKWFFLKAGKEYHAGYGFSAYYVMNFIFLLPLWGKLVRSISMCAGTTHSEKKTVISYITAALGMLIILLIPGVVSDVFSFGACSDLTMGILYGTSMLLIMDILTNSHKDKGEPKEDIDEPKEDIGAPKEDIGGDKDIIKVYLRLGIYLSVLVLCKSVGIEWAAFATILYIVLAVCLKRFSKKGFWTFVGVYALFQGSWWGFCLINRRIAKLTSSGVDMIKGNGYSFKDILNAKTSIFWKGLTGYPLHTTSGGAINLSALALFLILIAVIVLLKVFGKMEKRTFSVLLIYTIFTAIVAYGVILYGHLTVFAYETQYEDPAVMAMSASRYSLPFTIGTLMLVVGLIVDLWAAATPYTTAAQAATAQTTTARPALPAYIPIILTAAFILLSTNYTALYDTVWGYRATLAEDAKALSDMIDENADKYIQVCDEKKAEDEAFLGHRVLYLQNTGDISWVGNSYVNLAVSPVPTIYGSYYAGGMDTDGSDIPKGIIVSGSFFPGCLSKDAIMDVAKLHHAEYIYQDVAIPGSDIPAGEIIKVE